MKYLAAVLLLSFSVWGVDVTLESPVRFPYPEILAQVQSDRGGPQYSPIVEGETSGGIFQIKWKFKRANDNVIVAATDPDFVLWNNAQSTPYLTQILNVTAFSSKASIAFSGVTGLAPLEFIYTHSLPLFDSDIITLNYVQAPMQPIFTAQRLFTVNVVNRKPVISIQASPIKIAPGGTSAFIPTTSDADGHPITVSYAYGDGTSGTEAFHTYSTPGVYTVTASANDGFDTVTQSIDIEVVGDAQRVPVPRFTTSDVVGFVGIPLAFDASFSTDPQNAIQTYSWNFGDNSPAGSGQVVSRTYTTAGSYLVTLTVLDGEGIQAKTARAIEILPAELLGTFNAGVEFSTVFDRTKQSKDTLSLKATLNTGDAIVGDGTSITLAIIGQEFTAILDRKLRATTSNGYKFIVKAKAGVRKQAAGQIDLQITVKNAALGLGFNQAGVLDDNDDLVEVTLPIRIDIGAKSFEVNTDAVFQFNRTGTRARGEGSSE